MASYKKIQDITDLDTRIRVVDRLLKLREQLAAEFPALDLRIVNYGFFKYFCKKQ